MDDIMIKDCYTKFKMAHRTYIVQLILTRYIAYFIAIFASDEHSAFLVSVTTVYSLQTGSNSQSEQDCLF